MARTQSADYDKRRDMIRDVAAELYAKKGFLGASIAAVAEACDTSKSLIYHYYPSKEDILFDVMDTHVQMLVEAAQRVEAEGGAPETRLRHLAHELMRLYNGAQVDQKILLNELSNLPPERRAEIVRQQRLVIDVVDRLLIELRPHLSDNPTLRRPIVMMFFGMLNWTHIWFDPNGPVKSGAIADMATDMFLGGLPA
ncbi:TetR/AcrR family transcriptional regulator [Acidocella aromatica]|uniref:AcrR family transcriptional regulator n=1 Tax=Acidocella aromatica TaxID=1303579 RepID=A0A840VIK2_9PROT|nr:TetR/AcrR family transcriptional regulator [Acidocella aromatica]MBB5373015.1 AcrR family transcriptional regulator [Acidocella aromatica]